MAIPDFQTIMLPLLRLCSDGKAVAVVERRKQLADHFKLTKEELAEPLPSGTQPVFSNRVAWASVYLFRSGLLTRPRRGHYEITDLGRDVLKKAPKRIDIKFLLQFPGLREFRQRGAGKKPPAREPETPEEALEKAHQRHHAALADDLLGQAKSCTPAFFEKLVVELLVKMGYGGSRRDAGQAIGKSGDEGIDGIIKEDRLGLDTIYIQAKRWEGNVGRPEIQKFVGALHGQHARKGVFITTSSFAANARDYAKAIDPKVVLIDGEQLANLMIDFGVGVTTQAAFELKRLDSDYFEES